MTILNNSHLNMPYIREKMRNKNEKDMVYVFTY